MVADSLSRVVSSAVVGAVGIMISRRVGEKGSLTQRRPLGFHWTDERHDQFLIPFPRCRKTLFRFAMGPFVRIYGERLLIWLSMRLCFGVACAPVVEVVVAQMRCVCILECLFCWEGCFFRCQRLKEF